MNEHNFFPGKCLIQRVTRPRYQDQQANKEEKMKIQLEVNKLN